VYELTDREKKALKAIKNDPEAKRDLDFLRRKIGCSEEFLITSFVIEAWFPAFNNDLPTAAERQSLKVLAKLIDDLARRIQDANDLPYWRLAFLRVDLIENDGFCSEESLKALPVLLRLYGRNIRKKVETEESFSRHDKVRDAEFEATEALLSWIRQKTGRRYRDRVASIQRIIYGEAGRKRLPASGETLRKREQRKRPDSSPLKTGTF
jgi:hypothetical protein